MKYAASNRLLAGRPIRDDTLAERSGGKSARTVTVNLAESPLGLLSY